jgi:hypothetical protein
MSDKGSYSKIRKEIQDKVKATKEAIKDAEKKLTEGKITEEKINEMRVVLQDNIDKLHTIAQNTSEVIIRSVNLAHEIEQLEFQIKFPNHRVKIFSRQQEEEQTRARVDLARWSDAGVGVSMKDLSPDEIGELSSCATAEWSPLTTKIEELVEVNKDKDSSLLSAYRNVAIGCFEAVVPQWFGHNIPNESTMAHQDQRKLLECIAKVAVDTCKDNDYNPASVFADAIASGNLKSVGDIISSGFGLCVLAQSGAMSILEAGVSLSSLAGQVVKYVVTNPAASFVTYTAAEPYINGLINQVLNERFPPDPHGRQRPEDIKDLFDRLSKYYRHNGVTDIIGFPPADLDSIRNKLSQLLYEAGYRVVSSAQMMGDTFRAAVKFPKSLFKIAKRMGDAIMTSWTDFGIKLIDRYGIMPHNIQNDWFPRVMMCLDHEGLLDGTHQFIELAVRRCLNHSLPTIPYHHLVARLEHLSDVQYGALLPPGIFSDSLEARIDDDSPRPDLETRGLDTGSGAVVNLGEIHGDLDVLSSHGAELADFRNKMQAIMARAIQRTESIAEKIQHDIEQQKQSAVAQGGAAAAAAQAGAQAPPAAARPAARGGDPRDPRDPGLGSLTGTGYNSNSAFENSGRRGGHSRSRKHSVSKRTRRKGVGKKQKSKKNKRQSRRKVRRASSRKLRK